MKKVNYRDMTRQFLQECIQEQTDPPREELSVIEEAHRGNPNKPWDALFPDEATPKQMSLNQTGVDLVKHMADQIEPMFEQFRKTAGQSAVAANDPLYNQIEQILLDLPGMLEDIADKMEAHGVEGGLA